LRAIAGGARTQKEISVRAGLAQGHVSKYLSVLRDAGFVQRRVPVTATESSRLGRYHVIDPYLRFYYRFLFARQAQLAMNEPDPALAEIKRHFLDFIGAHTWEEICREWTLRAGVRGILPFATDQVGGAWTKQAQVDVVGVNSMEKTIFLGECKWQDRPVSRSVLRQLVAKTTEIVPKRGQWRVCYLGFARDGWTEAAQQYANKISATELQEDNWRSAGMRLLDLNRIDTDLRDWVRAV
jgi:AAA+ ATPase superfamily predicted ATPase